ncbi:WD domain-containing protein, putative [Phytophthora infestans T30-4]|uniref:WD domain-containing protein, putative n=2 Tax=Phytophthora infestans TaxID=4787 RepID=D0P140_PHYIT|nr:WD domain-containing protein, putative [Phytophthora infestans T30-4]EEY53755.1 WD domain-containing protein, putative [Phytophthora infestans T30-4]|eukprot:XP_002895979.1 WD domain-containing protein, putative [Phytophthora infestans T30-4]
MDRSVFCMCLPPFVTNCRSALNGVYPVLRTDHLVAVQEGKLALSLWSWGKNMPVWKCHDVKTGELVAVFDAHYKRVSALDLTSDDSHLDTASENALMHVWRLLDLLDEPDAASSFQQGVTPVVSFTDHVLPVTSLHVGLGGVKARIYTSSLGRTCKIWSLNYPPCLDNVPCPSYVNVCIADPMEQRIFMGCGNGHIYALDLNAAATSVTAATACVANASTGSLSAKVAPWGPEATLSESFKHHESSVTTLQTQPS